MRFDAFTIFPEIMRSYLKASVIGRAQEAGLVQVGLHDLRDYTADRHRTTDDVPYGGGGGMVMKPEPIFAAVEGVLGDRIESTPVILLTPQGRVFDQQVARDLAKHDRLALICGRYEGVDERVREHLATDEISIGDYVLTGGELPALIVIDTVARLVPGVLGDQDAARKDSHMGGLLEHPHYTRPAEYRGWDVPDVLRSGDHARVEAWRRRESLRRTLKRRPELLNEVELTAEERVWLEGLEEQEREEGEG